MNAIINPLDPENPLPAKTVVIIGMPGSGKSSVGRKLAARLGLSFFDSDLEVEKAAGMKVEQIFEKLGEPAFREGERRVIARLLEQPPHVLATGGGAFMDKDSRHLIQSHAISIWLRVDFPILFERTSRRNDRPLLKGENPEQKLKELLAAREPFYAKADVTVTSDRRPADETVDRLLKALGAFVRQSSPCSRQPRQTTAS